MNLIVNNIAADNLVSFQETGSNYICNPPVVDTDIDYIVLVNDIEKAHTTLIKGPWVYTSLEYETMAGDNFKCYRRGMHNLIVTQDTNWYLKFCAATEYCKAKNVLKKEDRIMYFSLILHDKYKPIAFTAPTITGTTTTTTHAIDPFPITGWSVYPESHVTISGGAGGSVAASTYRGTHKK